MNVILVLGAGRSSSVLIPYLLKEAEKNGWRILVGDLFKTTAEEKIGVSSVGEALTFDIADERIARLTISRADIVVSLLPPHLHAAVARYCVELQKHLITASYVSTEMRAFGEEAQHKNLLFLNECGLDPGIDHMSVMNTLNRIKGSSGKIISVESFTGGLIAPETDAENPWRYKFTWNPHNVVVAGQSAAKFLENGHYKYIPYQQLFSRTIPVHVNSVDEYEGYVNRDSLSYVDTYNLQGVQTMLRGTLREKGYCSAWNVFVQLGCCDDSYLMENVDRMTHQDFINAFLQDDPSISVMQKIASQLRIDLNGSELQKLKWSGFFTNERIGLTSGTPAQILQHILNKKWKLDARDKDRIVMWHRFVYEIEGTRKEVQASLTVTGDDAINTAMAKTVGLPLGIAAKYLMKGKIKQRGVKIPTEKEIYELILNELKTFGIDVIEKYF